MDQCVFCMIARGEMEAKIVYEDETLVAFDDIMPQAPVHTLIIPREHFAHLSDGVPVDLIGRLFAAIPLVAKAKGIEESGYRVIVNTGRDAAQTVQHLHVHVIGGAPMSHGMVSFGVQP